MKISLLYPDCITDDKKGASVYIANTVECEDLYSLAAAVLTNHIAVGVFRDNYRSGNNWQCGYVFGVDFDNGESSEQVTTQLTKQGINHIIVGSKNHLRDKGDGKGIIERFHVFIPFAEPIIEPTLYAFIANTLCRLMNWTPDMATTKDKCRYYFKHRELLYVYEDGKPLPLEPFIKVKQRHDALLAKKEEIDRKDAERKRTLYGETTALQAFKATKYFKMLGECNKDGNRYSASNSIIGGMLKCGLDVSEAMQLFDQYATYGVGFTRDSVEHRFNKWR